MPHIAAAFHRSVIFVYGNPHKLNRAVVEVLSSHWRLRLWLLTLLKREGTTFQTGS
jgi:hypothetical protein